MRTPFSHLIDRNDLHDGVLVQMRDALLRTLTRWRPALAASELPAVRLGDRGDAAVLPFPIRGEALLVNLASTLRERALRERGVDDVAVGDPFLMAMSRGPRPRLSLDRDAYVEFCAEDASYHLKIDAAPASRLTLETTEFTTLVKFVLQYLAERDGQTEHAGDAP